MSDSLAVLPQYLLPKKALTVFAGWVAGAKGGALTTALIRWFVKRYNVTMAEAQEPDVAAYASFNDFFTRALKPGARPLAAAHYLCPVDGAISQFGPIAGDQIFQAKGHHYSTTALVGGDAALAAQFQDGSFATLYLSPRDYHRIHMPCDGSLRRMVYVPGDLFSVNPTTARGVPGLFARNERLVCVFDSANGPFVLTLVGATIVGSMATVWHGQVNPLGRPKGKRTPSGGREPHAVGERGGQASPPRSPQICEWQYTADQVVLRKGEEMGRFLLGSTVVMLFGKDRLAFNPDWSAARPVRMGEAMGNSA